MSRRPSGVQQDEHTGEGFLSRWSRRKSEGETADSVTETTEVSTHDQPDTVEPAPVLTDADMPDIETIHEDSDVSGFLSPGVSEALRNRALKKMFLSAAFNVRDGLDEYDDDFTTFEKLGDIVTADMKHQREMEEARKKMAEALETDDIETGLTGADQQAAEEEAVSDAADDASRQPESNDDNNDQKPDESTRSV